MTSLCFEYVQHALLSCKNESFDAVLILQATSPFTIMKDVQDCLELFESKRPDSVVSVAQVAFEFHPSKFKRLTEGGGLKPYFEEEKAMEYQNLPKAYTRNGSIYLTSIDCINMGRVIGDNCLGYEMPTIRSVDINDMFDFAFAEFLGKKYHGL